MHWRHAVERRGRCFLIGAESRGAESRWEPIATRGDLVLMRRSPPERGLPPLYVPAASAARQAGPPSGASLDPDTLAAPLTAISQESLPPPAPAAQPPAAQPAAAQPPAAQPSTVRAPPPVQQAKVQVRAAAPPAAAIRRADASPRGYAVGFVLAVLLIILILATLALLLRLLLRRAVEPMRPVETSPRTSLGPLPTVRCVPPPIMLPVAPRASVGLAPQPAAIQEADAQRHCADLLRQAGWQVRVGATVTAARADHGRACDTDRGIDLVARRGGRVLALRCPPRAAIVNEEVVEQACLARERERADRAAIVSEAPYAAAARKLAMQTGIDLLEPDQLSAFAR